MKDNAIVLSVDGDFAGVQVESQEACLCCSARALCSGGKKADGRIRALNGLQARPGDRVVIEIPEGRYSRELILFFGLLLAGALVGIAAGYGLGLLLGTSPDRAALPGLAGGLLLAGLWISRLHRKQTRKSLYPVVTEIVSKGETHG